MAFLSTPTRRPLLLTQQADPQCPDHILTPPCPVFHLPRPDQQVLPDEETITQPVSLYCITVLFGELDKRRFQENQTPVKKHKHPAAQDAEKTLLGEGKASYHRSG